MNALLLALPLLAPSAHADDPPPVFRDLSYEEALARSAEEDRLLILDAMTSWCAPCKQMDRTTWIDPRLVAWIGERAIAIQLDMDEHVALKEELRISAFPTIVLFRDGAEIDRVVGLRTGDQMLAWLGANLEGRTAADVLLERLAALRGSADGASVWDQRFRIAEELSLMGAAPEELLAETVWLWRTALDGEARANAGQRYRRSRVSGIMTGLARTRDDARAAYRALRAELDPAVAADTAGSADQADWLRLNRVLGEDAGSVTWAERQAESEAGRARLLAAEPWLFELLADRGSWRAAGFVLDAPVVWAERSRDSLIAFEQYSAERDAPSEDAPGEDAGGDADAGPREGGADEPGRAVPAVPVLRAPSTAAMPMIRAGTPGATPGEQLAAQYRSDAARRYGALLAAGRGDKAGAMAEVVLGHLDDAPTRAALVGAALRAGALASALETHQRWLDEAAR